MRITWKRPAALALVLCAAAVAGFLLLRKRNPDDAPPPPDHVDVASDTFALLVGCTEYPELEKVSDPETYRSRIRLLGPGNDVALMRDVLHRYLGVPDANIRVLTGWSKSPADEATRPTRANILGNLERLARDVPSGSHVFFLYAGHGSQQPDAADGDESDGRDEVLLPSDAGRWDPVAHGIRNVITDDEIRAHLVALRDAGADVWAVFDCCHSGTMTRGIASNDGAESVERRGLRMRGLPPSLLGVPERESDPSSGRGLTPVTGGVLKGSGATLRGIAAICAVHSSEPAPEMDLPVGEDASDSKPHGLCTFRVARVLQRYGGSLTLAELFEHVSAAYAEAPLGATTPLAEGDLSLRAMPGTRAAGSMLLLRRDGDRLVLGAGSLRGLTVGSSIDVYRPGELGESAALLGRLTLTDVEPLRSVCGAVEGGPALSGIPDGAPCRIAEVVPGGPPLRLSLVDAVRSAKADDPSRSAGALSRLDARARAQFPVVAPEEADWQVRGLPAVPDGVARFMLSPARPDAGIEPLEVVGDELVPTLERVRRSRGLRGWAANGPLSTLPAGLKLEASFRRFGSDAREPMRPGVSLAPGDSIRLDVTNGTERDIDVVVKCLDAAQNESQFWPDDATSALLTREENRPVTTDEQVITDDGSGLESLIAIVATRAEGAGRLDVGSLSGPAVGANADAVASRQAEHALLDAIGAKAGASRGIDAKPAVSVAVREFAWTTSWGRFVLPPDADRRMVSLDPAVCASPESAAGDVRPPGRNVTWRRAGVFPGASGTADALLLSGEGEKAGEEVFGIFVDEDGDAGIGSADPAATARRAVAGELAVELLVVIEPTRSSAAYPRKPLDTALGFVRVGTAERDRADQLFELGVGGWRVRETCGPWLSTSFIRFRSSDPDSARPRVVSALRRFLHPR